MRGIPFDTHSYVKRLVAAGMPEAQAEVLAEVWSQTVVDHLATKQDLHELEERLNARIEQTEERLNARIEQTEERLNARIDHTEERLNARMDSRLHDLEMRMTLRTGGMIATAVAVLAVLMKVL